MDFKMNQYKYNLIINSVIFLSIGSVPSVPNFADLTAVGIDTQPPIIANATLSIEKLS